MDAQRALLDQLLGRNRNTNDEDAVEIHFYDDEVCKRFLVGLVCMYAYVCVYVYVWMDGCMLTNFLSLYSASIIFSSTL